jgi:hypothetical protein
LVFTQLKVVSYNASVFRVTTPSSELTYVVNLINYNSTSWVDIMSDTDSSTWTGGEFWNMTDQWEEFYQTQSLVSHGDLYLAIDQISLGTQRFPMDSSHTKDIMRFLTSEAVCRSLVADMTTGLPGWMKVDHVLVKEEERWLSYNTTLEGGLLHVRQASSRKRDVIQDRVQVSLYFMVVVVCFNILKLVTLSYVLVTDRSAYLVTLGDAASSFLEHQDPHTKGKCVFGRDEMLLSIGHPLGHHEYTDKELEGTYQRMRGLWRPHRQPYKQGARFVLLVL